MCPNPTTVRPPIKCNFFHKSVASVMAKGVKVPRSKLPKFSFSEPAPKSAKKSQSIHVHNAVSEASGSKQTTSRSFVNEPQHPPVQSATTLPGDVNTGEVDGPVEGSSYHITEDDVRQAKRFRRTKIRSKRMKRVRPIFALYAS